MTEDLKRFIEAFEDEDALQRAVEALLTRMPGCRNVRSTHGALEYGKDLVFSSEGPMGETIVNACVIKFNKITGEAGSNVGARTVFQQIEQAFDTPILGEQGEPQSIARVYVITCHECTPQAMESIRGKLRDRSGQTMFLCGNELLSKFKRYWPDFLLSNLSFLGAHIRSLRDQLARDASVIRLLFKEGFSGGQSKGPTDLYVPPRLFCTLRQHTFNLILPQPQDFDRPLRENGALRIGDAFRHLGQIVRALNMDRLDTSPPQELLSEKMFKFADSISEAWSAAFNAYRTRPDLNAQQQNQPKHQTAITLGGASFFGERSQSLINTAAPALESLRRDVGIANQVAVSTFEPPKLLLSSPDLTTYNSVCNFSRLIPSVVVAANARTRVPFDSNLLAETRVPLLITGPAGYGKTSFCRCHALNDLEALETGTSKVLPIYIQLHKLASTLEGQSFQAAFLRSDDLVSIWNELTTQKESSEWHLRIYLDGLDEVASLERQIQIAKLAEEGAQYENVQIVMTARDHVSGPWLSWMRRLELQGLDDKEIRQLVLKWLDGDTTQLRIFYDKLKEVPSLASLMKVPLLATLILSVYKHGHESLPESRPRLYEMFVRLLAGGWDAAKNVNRGSKFAAQTKIAILSHLAGRLHSDRARDCTGYDVKSAIRERVPGMQDQWQEVVSELIVDGLLVPNGSILSFPHLSFQEFLAAKDLIQLKPDRANQRLDAFLKGDDWWRDVLHFYISSQDKPSETEDWIRSAVLRTFSKVADATVRSRATELCRTLLTNFNGFRFSRETADLLNWRD